MTETLAEGGWEARELNLEVVAVSLSTRWRW